MTNQVLYRAWRPQDFEELSGQEHIRRTLENAVQQDKVSHAYLFAGPRGTGKTTTARILAKVVNCAHREGVNPCGVCESCQSIVKGSSLDVMEIDAASNRGIEHIRDLKEKTVFLPAIGKYRVFIIDEAHMLTTEAFNALLKSLEEPPEHVIFVLATTEAQRVPETVLSRCQRFDFRKLSYDTIKARLDEILAGEGREAEPEALAMIIRQADGSMRDAIGLLDQCLSYSLAALTAEDASSILGLVRQDVLASLFSSIVSKDAAALFAAIDAQCRQGRDPQQILREFAGYCRDLLLMALCGTDTALVTATEEQRRVMTAQSTAIEAAALRGIVTQAETAASGVGYRGNSRYMAEAMFAGLLLSVGSKAQGQSASAQAPQAQLATQAQAAPVAKTTPAVQAQEAAPQAQIAPAAQAEPRATVAPKAQAAPPTQPQAQATPSSQDSVRGSSTGLSPAQWEQFMQSIKARKVILHAFLVGAVQYALNDGVLTLSFDPAKGAFHKERCEEKDNTDAISETLAEMLGSPVEVRCEFLGGAIEKDPVDQAIEFFGRDIVKLV